MFFNTAFYSMYLTVKKNKLAGKISLEVKITSCSYVRKTLQET